MFTGFFRQLALDRKFVDKPNPKRKIHKKAVPLMGGCAIWLSFFGLLWAHWLVFVVWGDRFSFLPQALTEHLPGALGQGSKIAVITLGGLVIAGMGLFDDRFGLTPKKKFLWQIGVGLFVSIMGIRLSLFTDHNLLLIFLSTFWVVLLTNSFNLLDNMDGLSSGVALIASVIFAIVAIVTQQYFLAVSLSLLAGTLAGFMIWNFHPAKIFMGDCGSQLIGYLIAVFTILETFYTPASQTTFAVVMPLLILAVPLYDTGSVIVIRFLKGESIFKADTRHFSHRIKALGMSVSGTVLFLYLVTLAVGLSAPLLPFVSNLGVCLIFIQALCVMSVIAILEYFGEKRLAKK